MILLSPERLPQVGDAERAAVGLEHWNAAAAKLEDPAAAKAVLLDPSARRLLEAIFSNSPFLSQCLLGDLPFFLRLLAEAPEPLLDELVASLRTEARDDDRRETVMRRLRVARRRAALLVALADLAGGWELRQVTSALTRFADAALAAALARLLVEAAGRGELAPADPKEPTRGCGLVCLAMGKYGAWELNYSSDIDLIVLFDPKRIDYRGRRSPQEAMVRLVRDLVVLLERRTGDGYAFRVDLRLRPDPAATPLAVSLEAALTYYESMGQNWERAAMIKARPAAGDLDLGNAFLKELRPFVWRKSFDFAAIQDIHSIKRQINAHKGGAHIRLRGQDIKLGRGGIREIEFFAQTQQLIYGGRQPALRKRRTLDALSALAAAGRAKAEEAAALAAAYRYLRRLEHRLQMVDDQQTHKLPEDEAGLAQIAAFMGYDGPAPFRAELLGHLKAVESVYGDLFEEAPSLAAPGNLVFTGGDPEPATLATLKEMGFGDGEVVFNLVRGWHHSRYRATRSTRAREVLTELMPGLLQALARTPNPDAALVRFDAFLAGLPAGVQLFSLLRANPSLLELLAEIMGTAPALADHLSRNPEQLDAVLSADFFAAPPSRAAMDEELAALLAQGRDFQDLLDLSRRWAHDRQFQIGVQILRHTADFAESGRALSDIAEAAISALAPAVRGAFERAHGALPGPGLAILGLGKLGSAEMTVDSDLDLIFIYESAAGVEASDGAKPLASSHYFARLAQRTINAITAPTAEGKLYEIDMRLRPSGTSGPIATDFAGFRRYQEKEAWTWEHMALTRARVIFGNPAFAARIGAAVHAILSQPRDPERLLRDVAEMRARIAREHGTPELWQIKRTRGGLIDLEFLAQYLQLRHAEAHPEVLSAKAEGVFDRLASAGLMAPERAAALISASRLLRAVQGFLRLTAGAAFDEAAAPAGLKASLALAAGCPDFPTLKAKLAATVATVLGIFEELVEVPAATARDRRIEISGEERD